MLGSKSFELIKDLDRNPITIPAFNDDLVRQVLVEIQDIYAANSRDAWVAKESMFTFRSQM